MDQGNYITKLFETAKAFIRERPKYVEKCDGIFAYGINCGKTLVVFGMFAFPISGIPNNACYICLCGGIATIALGMLLAATRKGISPTPTTPIEENVTASKSQNKARNKGSLKQVKVSKKTDNSPKDSSPNIKVQIFNKNNNLRHIQKETLETNFANFKVNNIEGLISLKHYEDLNALYDIISKTLEDRNGKNCMNKIDEEVCGIKK